MPQLTRIYPNGSADVNHFQAAGGIGFLIATLLDAGLLHEDVLTVAGRGLSAYRREPTLATGALTWQPVPTESLDPDVLRPASDPFAADGGLRVVEGNLGRAVVKVSAVAPDQRVVTAPARVFDDQADFLAAFDRGELDGDLVAVVRYQGPGALGMPELHKLTPALGVLQDRGHRVALVTDGRMSGASGKVLAAIHLTPEAAEGGAIARIVDGDLVTVDAEDCSVRVELSDAALAERAPTGAPLTAQEWAGTGRELFAAFRRVVGAADRGASVFDPTDPAAVPAPSEDAAVDLTVPATRTSTTPEELSCV